VTPYVEILATDAAKENKPHSITFNV